MKFQPIFQYLNIFSEVFVPGGGSSQDSAATKVWLTEVVPELNIKSANDICLKVNIKFFLCYTQFFLTDKFYFFFFFRKKKFSLKDKIIFSLIYFFFYDCPLPPKFFFCLITFNCPKKLKFLKMNVHNFFLFFF